ncbi:MAG: RNA methyltransferase [Myxococcales bacterium]|nr:RNA methyltransferase [Myxococcales bacterium]
MDQKFFASCVQGAENILLGECVDLGLRGVEKRSGGAVFQGPFSDGMRAALWLRTAHRVFLSLKTFACTTPEELYDGVHALDWEELIRPEQTLAVDAVGMTPKLKNTVFTAQRTKDAVVDRIREKAGRRPDVDPKKPDVAIFVHLTGGRARVSLDVSGQSLHRRGYRSVQVEAPLKESLAATILRWTEWDMKRPLIDPMCGGGTLAIEAALWSQNRPPGLHQRHAFLKWPSCTDEHKEQWRELCAEGLAGIRRENLPRIRAADWNRKTLDAAKKNAKTAGVASNIQFLAEDFLNAPPCTEPAVIVTNPPYGHRVGGNRKQIESFFRRLGQTIREYKDCDVFVLSGNADLHNLSGMRYDTKIKLMNGSIPCELLYYRP